jgi:hypothetical protein
LTNFNVFTADFFCSPDILGELMSKLSVPRSKPKLVEKILELGLVEDKKDLRKKRKGKNRSDGTRRGRKAADGFIDSDDQSEPDEREGRPSGTEGTDNWDVFTV